MAKNYEFDNTARMTLVAEMLGAAKGKPKEQQAINSYVAWHQAEETYPEPDVSGLVSWSVECAIASDLGHIYRAKRPEGVFGSEYTGEYRKIKAANARKAAARRAKKNQTGMDKIRAALTI